MESKINSSGIYVKDSMKKSFYVLKIMGDLRLSNIKSVVIKSITTLT